MTDFTGLTVVCCESNPEGSWRWMIGSVGWRCTYIAAKRARAETIRKTAGSTEINRWEPVPHRTLDEDPPMLWDEGTWRNKAVNQVETSHVVFTNSDCIVTAQALLWLIDRFRENPNRVVNGQRREVGFESTQSLILDHFEEDGRGWDPEKIERIGNASLPRNWYMAMGDFQACPVQAFKEVGGYDETMTGYGGHDFDLHDRLVCWGLKPLISKEPMILHLYHGTDLKRSEHHEKHEQRLKKYAETGDSNLLRTNPHRLLEWGVSNGLPGDRRGSEVAGEGVVQAVG